MAINIGGINVESVSDKLKRRQKLLQDRKDVSIETEATPITDNEFNTGVDRGDIGITEGRTIDEVQEVEAAPKKIVPGLKDLDKQFEQQTEAGSGGQPFDVIANQIKKAGGILKTDEEGNQLFDKSKQAAFKSIGEGIEQDEAQYDQSSPDLFDTVSPDVLLDRLRNTKSVEPTVSTTDEASSFIDNGVMVQDEFDRTALPFFNSGTKESEQILNILSNGNLIDTNNLRISPNLANNALTAILEVMRDLINKEDELVTKPELLLAKNELNAQKYRAMKDKVKKVSLQNKMIDASDLRKGLFTKVMNRVMENPKALGIAKAPGAQTGFGGFGETLNPNTVSAGDAVLFQVLSNLGWIQKIPKENNPELGIEDDMIVISEKGEMVLQNTRGILDDLLVRDITFRSKVPGVDLPTRARFAGERKRGTVSQTNKMSYNTYIEDTVKQLLKSMPLTVVDERYNMANQLIDSVIITDDDVTVLGFKEEGVPGRRWSKGDAAKTLGLDEAHWQKAFNHAKKLFPEERAEQQANLVMIREAKKLLKLKKYAAEETNGGVYYNKQFHASSVGRYFIRNTDINSQLNKVARMFVGNAVAITLDPRKDTQTQTYKNWAYIIGKNILPPSSRMYESKMTGLGAQRTEDLTYNTILNTSLSILSNPNDPVYTMWVEKGRKIKEAYLKSKQEPQTLADFKNLVGQDLFNELFDPEGNGMAGEWGYPYQSYMDVYDFNVAREKGTAFKAKSQTQHDGKQNGIAIQAMQFGRRDILQLVGAMYSTGEVATPFGDIRDRFLEKMDLGIKVAFTTDEDRLAYWLAFKDELMKDKGALKTFGKELSKTPLMETSYAKYEGFNEETAINFIDKNPQLFEGIVMAKSNGYSRDDMISDLNDIITETLRETLNLRNQKILKEAGYMWAKLGVTPKMKGPLGTDIYMGSYDYKPMIDPLTGQAKTVEVATPDGTVYIPITKRYSTGSAKSKKKKLIRVKNQDGYAEWKREDDTDRRFGQEVANQLPVLTVQQIDGAIMAKTIYRANIDNLNRSSPAFVIPIHDAIITDASSVKLYHSMINQQFREVNMSYSIGKEVLKGVDNAYNNVTKKLMDDPKGQQLMNNDSKYRAVHDELVRIKTEIDKIKGQTAEERFGDGRPRGRKYKKPVNLTPKNKETILAIAEAEGWKPDGTGAITNEGLAAILEIFYKDTNLRAGLENLALEAKAARKKIYNQLLKTVMYQYN